MNDDEILRELENIEKNVRFGEIRRVYRRLSKKPVMSLKSRYLGGKVMLKAKEPDPIVTSALAHGLMEDAMRIEGDHNNLRFKYGMLGAQLYEKIGKGRKAIPRLLKIYKRGFGMGERIPENEIEDFVRRNLAYKEVDKYLKRGSEERQEEGGLAGRVGVFALFIAGGAALSFGSLTITGNAVSNLTRTTPGLLGIILFIVGFVGMFFYFKER